MSNLYMPQSDRLLTCPYEPAHKVKESRFQLHISKCKLEHLNVQKVKCPFNATHVLNRKELDFHLINCPDREQLDRQVLRPTDKTNAAKGRTAVPQYSDPLPSEEWEINDIHLQRPPTPPGAVVEPPPMAKPAERRRLYRDLHLQCGAESSKASSSTPSPLVKSSIPAPRQPKQLSESQKIKHNGSVESQSLGLGRGKPSSRIAANIFPKQNGVQPASSVRSYNEVLQGINNLHLGLGRAGAQEQNNQMLGIGRGQIPNQQGGTAYTPSYDDDDDEEDFPALGSLGRGSKPSKQSLRKPGSKPEK